MADFLRHRLNRFRRFSLSTLLLLVLAFACGATIWKLRSDLSQVRTDLAALRQRGGHLEVSDLNVIHAVRVPTEHGLQWVYRIYIPEHLEVEVYWYGWDFQSGYPRNEKYPKVLGPGEHLLTYTLNSNSLGNTANHCVIRSPKKTTKSWKQTSFDHSWTTKDCVYAASLEDFKSPFDRRRWRNFFTLQLDETKPFALMRYGPKVKEGKDVRRPGVMVWLNPLPRGQGFRPSRRKLP